MGKLCLRQTNIRKANTQWELRDGESSVYPPWQEAGRLSHRVLRGNAGCISYMRQKDNIYNNRVYRDKCHNNQCIYYIAEILQNKR
jgi:hypothetical protein